MSSTPTDLARTYFDAWQAGDWDRLRSILADDATFAGPMGVADDAEACIAGLRGMSKMITRLEIRAMVADETDVITWYDLVVGDKTLPTANWSHAEEGRITRIRAAFDPRPILPPG